MVEWREAYVVYAELKRMIKDVKEHLSIQQRARAKSVVLGYDENDSLILSSSPVKAYTSKDDPVRRYEDKLDAELAKVEAFYLAKVLSFKGRLVNAYTSYLGLLGTYGVVHAEDSEGEEDEEGVAMPKDLHQLQALKAEFKDIFR